LKDDSVAQIGVKATSRAGLDHRGDDVSEVGPGSQEHRGASKIAVTQAREPDHRNRDLVRGKATNE
jgi:hypothetical protein